MAVIGFRAPAAGFDHPIEMWQACHERVKRMSALLQRLAQHRDLDPALLRRGRPAPPR